MVNPAYAAGFFEGEHTVAICSDFTLRVMRLGDEDDDWPFRALQDRWGGQIELQRPINRRPHHEWTLNAHEATRFLADIRPFVSGEHARRRIDDLALRLSRD